MHQISKRVNEDKIIETGKDNKITRCTRENARRQY